MSNKPTKQTGKYVIGSIEQGDFVRVPATNSNIGTNKDGDFVGVPPDSNRGMAYNRHDDTNTFQIFFATDSKTYTFDVLSTYTVGQLMNIIQRELQIPKELQRLMYAGKKFTRAQVIV